MGTNEENNTDSLIEELNKESSGGSPMGSSDHFEPERKKQVDISTGEEVRQEPALSRSTIEKMAASWINRLDTFNRLVYTPLYRWSILEKEDLKQYQEFKRKHSGESEKEVSEAIKSDDAMWNISQRMDKCATAINKVPYTKEEKEDLIQPMADLIEKYKKLQLGPEWMFVIAFGFSTLARIEPFIPDFKTLFSSDDTEAKL
jgi:hypothetical protein